MNQFRTPPEKRPLRAPALAATTFAVIAAAVAGSCGSEAASDQGSASTVRRIHLIEIVRGNTQLNLGRKGFSPGDRQTITSDVYNRAGRKVGRLDADCAITAVGKRAGAVCGSVITLPNGQLTGQIFRGFASASSKDQAITGGTHEYARARGQIRVGREGHRTPFVIELR